MKQSLAAKEGEDFFPPPIAPITAFVPSTPAVNLPPIHPLPLRPQIRPTSKTALDVHPFLRPGHKKEVNRYFVRGSDESKMEDVPTEETTENDISEKIAEDASRKAALQHARVAQELLQSAREVRDTLSRVENENVLNGPAKEAAARNQAVLRAMESYRLFESLSPEEKARRFKPGQMQELRKELQDFERAWWKGQQADPAELERFVELLISVESGDDGDVSP